MGERNVREQYGNITVYTNDMVKRLPQKSDFFSTIRFFKNRVVRWYRRKIVRRGARWTIALIIVLAIFTYLTNPFVRFTLIIDPYQNVQYDNDQIVLERDPSLFVKNDAFFQKLALFKSGWSIFGNSFQRGQRAKPGSIDEIIREIHTLRFNPSEPFLISGDHFSQLYPRSLGIFYHSILDSRTALDQDDWQNRQLIYLKTTAYALQTFDQAGRLSTTIVPVGPRSVALMNIYAKPSDTLYSLLYALDQLHGSQFLYQTYPFENAQQYKLQTEEQAEKLITQYQPTLKRFLNEYIQNVYDPTTGLVRKNILLSGTKDMAKRQSAFYDNVVFWRTLQLAEQLGIIDSSPIELDALKQRIVRTYWIEDKGYFAEDLSDGEGQYSSDWLIVLMTGFLNPADEAERIYYQRSVEYIQRNSIDQPFALQYHPDQRKQQLYWGVKWFAPDYGSTAIWSNWGMEYLKLLSLLGYYTKDPIYLQQADLQLQSYTYNIKLYRGFPEVYNAQGKFFKQRFYRSVRQTGWVVSFEQARGLFNSIRETVITNSEGN